MQIVKIFNRLKEGNRRYVEGNPNRPHQNVERIAECSSKQSPDVIVLSCADSRVIPELVFDTGIGDLFVIRVAGNIANTSTIASIEFAISSFNSSLIVIMGHQNCGAVTSAIADANTSESLQHLLNHIKPCISKAKNPNSVDEIVHLNAVQTKNDLIKKSKIIADAVQADMLRIVPAFYSLETGVVEWINK